MKTIDQPPFSRRKWLGLASVTTVAAAGSGLLATAARADDDSARSDQDAESVLRFIDSQDVLMSATRLLKLAAIFLQVEGAGSQGITIDGGDLSQAATPLTFKNGADEKSVKVRG